MSWKPPKEIPKKILGGEFSLKGEVWKRDSERNHEYDAYVLYAMDREAAEAFHRRHGGGNFPIAFFGRKKFRGADADDNVVREAALLAYSRFMKGKGAISWGVVDGHALPVEVFRGSASRDTYVFHEPDAPHPFVERDPPADAEVVIGVVPFEDQRLDSHQNERLGNLAFSKKLRGESYRRTLGGIFSDQRDFAAYSVIREAYPKVFRAVLKQEERPTKALEVMLIASGRRSAYIG